MKWSQNEIKEAITLNQKGYRFFEIAKKFSFSRTEKAIKLKLNKLGYYENRYNNTKNYVCLNCNKNFESCKNEKRKFCSSSCSAKFNNKGRRLIKNCLNCNNQLNSHQKKYCSHDCMNNYIKKINYIKIENGDSNLSNDICKKYLIEKYGEKCIKCGWNETHTITQKVPIQLNHIDGNSENNSISNLEIICPNCHSLTPNFGFLNNGNGRQKRKLNRKKQKHKFGFYI